MVAQLMLRGFRHPTNHLDEILNRPLHVAEERIGEAIEMMIPDIRTGMASEPAEEVNEKLPAVLGLLIGVGMHWPHLPGCMYSLGKHALGRLKRVLAQTDLTVDLMQEAVAGQCAMTLPGFAVVVLAVEPCAQLLLVAIVQARLVALVARRRADGVGVGDLVGHDPRPWPAAAPESAGEVTPEPLPLTQGGNPVPQLQLAHFGVYLSDMTWAADEAVAAPDRLETFLTLSEEDDLLQHLHCQDLFQGIGTGDGC